MAATKQNINKASRTSRRITRHLKDALANPVRLKKSLNDFYKIDAGKKASLRRLKRKLLMPEHEINKKSHP